MLPELQKRCQSMKLETISLKTILKELDFLRKPFII